MKEKTAEWMMKEEEEDGEMGGEWRKWRTSE